MPDYYVGQDGGSYEIATISQAVASLSVDAASGEVMAVDAQGLVIGPVDDSGQLILDAAKVFPEDPTRRAREEQEAAERAQQQHAQQQEAQRAADIRRQEEDLERQRRELVSLRSRHEQEMSRINQQQQQQQPPQQQQQQPAAQQPQSYQAPPPQTQHYQRNTTQAVPTGAAPLSAREFSYVSHQSDNFGQPPATRITGSSTTVHSAAPRAPTQISAQPSTDSFAANGAPVARRTSYMRDNYPKERIMHPDAEWEQGSVVTAERGQTLTSDMRAVRRTGSVIRRDLQHQVGTEVRETRDLGAPHHAHQDLSRTVDRTVLDYDRGSEFRQTRRIERAPSTFSARPSTTQTTRSGFTATTTATSVHHPHHTHFNNNINNTNNSTLRRAPSATEPVVLDGYGRPMLVRPQPASSATSRTRSPLRRAPSAAAPSLVGAAPPPFFPPPAGRPQPLRPASPIRYGSPAPGYRHASRGPPPPWHRSRSVPAWGGYRDSYSDSWRRRHHRRYRRHHDRRDDHRHRSHSRNDRDSHHHHHHHHSRNSSHGRGGGDDHSEASRHTARSSGGHGHHHHTNHSKEERNPRGSSQPSRNHSSSTRPRHLKQPTDFSERAVNATATGSPAVGSQAGVIGRSGRRRRTAQPAAGAK